VTSDESLIDAKDGPADLLTGAAPHLLERPFYFYIALWGRRFSDYFLEYCVASLLAPNNIPALRTRQRSKMLIATRPEDWAYMKETPIFRLMERYVDAVYLEMPPCPADKSGCEHMGVGHKAALEMAHRDRAYGVLLTPDCLFSDGSVAALQRHACNGIELVMVIAALRLGEELFLPRLEEMGAIPRQSRRDSATPLSISGRQMSHAALTSFHSHAQSLEWDTPYISRTPSCLWWRVPGEDGIVILGLSWSPMLIDYGAVRGHDTSCLENWSIDGDYAYKNLGASSRMYVVRDSDEVFYAGFGPLADREFTLYTDLSFRSAWAGWMAKGQALREDFYSNIFDPLKREIFFLPLRWHANPLNRRWKRVERRALRTVLTFTWPKPLPRTLSWADGSTPMSIARARLRARVIILTAATGAAVLRVYAEAAPRLLRAYWAMYFMCRVGWLLWDRRRRVAQSLKLLARRSPPSGSPAE
jgi:hypothetical protein